MNGAQALRPRSAQQLHHHRFPLVVERVRRRDGIHPQPAQRLITQLTRSLFYALAFGYLPGCGVHAEHRQRHLQPLAQIPHKGLIFTRLGRGVGFGEGAGFDGGPGGEVVDVLGDEEELVVVGVDAAVAGDVEEEGVLGLGFGGDGFKGGQDAGFGGLGLGEEGDVGVGVDGGGGLADEAGEGGCV